MIPAVAERYDISDDGLVYTFTLREGVKFHNGDPVTAEDVIYSINRCAGNSGDSALVSALSAIQDLKATDERTVTFRLEQPDMELIYFLTAAIIPQSSEVRPASSPAPAPSNWCPALPRRTSSWSALTTIGALPPRSAR